MKTLVSKLVSANRAGGKLNIFASQKYSKKIQDKKNSQLLKHSVYPLLSESTRIYHSSKNSNITKTSLTNLQESIRQIFTTHSLRNTKMIQREHGTE